MTHINWFFISSLTLTITAIFLIIILLKYKKEKIHTMWILFNVAMLIWGIGATLISVTLDRQLSYIFWRIGIVGVTFTCPFIIHTIYLLINGKEKNILFFSYFYAILFSFLSSTTNLVLAPTSDTNTFNGFFVGSMGKLYWLWFALWFTTILYMLINLTKFYLTIRIKKLSTQIKYFIVSTSMAFFIGILCFFIHLKLFIAQFGNFGLIIYCLVATYAIFKHQLLGIEIAYRKGLFYSILIATLSAIYLLLIMFIEWFFRGLIGYKSLILSLSSALVIALLFNPLRNKLQALVDKLFLGKTPQEFAQENELLKQEVTRSDRLKTASTLALGLAHEIKNPLTTIKTFAEYLPEKYNDPEFVEKFSRLIPAEVERINNIIQQLLNFSKPTPPAFKESNIHKLIKDTLQFLSNDLLKKRIILEENYVDSTLTLKIDETQIKQVILNIVLNALESMPNGGTLTVETQIAKDDYFEINITDTGCGISKEDQKQIFVPFFSRKDSGTGLGLAISHQILNNHQGKIEVESQLGVGTTMRILLPTL